MSYKATSFQKEMQRAKAKAEMRDSFIARNYWLWVIIAFLIYPLASLLSAFTEGSHVYMRASMSGAPWLATIVFTLLIAILIEVLSYVLLKGAVDDIQAGVFSEDVTNISAFIIKLLGGLAILGFSVYLSVNGAPLLNERLRESYSPPTATYISTDSIAGYYDAKIAAIREDIVAARNTRYRGTITRDAMRSINNSQAQISELEAERATALAAADAENAHILSNWQAQTDINSRYAMGFAGLGEIIKLFCLLFIGIYDQGLSKEAAIFGGQAKPAPAAAASTPGQPIGFFPTPQQQNAQQEQQAPDPTARNPIGFRMPWVGAPVQLPDTDQCAPVRTEASAHYQDQEAYILEMALKNARNEFGKWKNKQEKGLGTSRTNQRHMQKWQRHIEVIEERLEELTETIK